MKAKSIIVTLCFALILQTTFCLAEEGLIGYWTFDEGNGDEVKDSSGLENNGVIKGKPQWKPGKNSMALFFTRQNQDYIEIVDNESLDIAEGITMSAWINPSSIYIGDDWKERNCVIAKRRSYYLDISENGNLASYLYNVLPQEWLVGETDMNQFIGKWVHVASTYDGKEHNLYVNGKLDASVKKSGTIAVNEDSLYIGWVDNNRYFDGFIDEVQLWSIGLTKEKIIGALSIKPESKLPTCWGNLKISAR